MNVKHALLTLTAVSAFGLAAGQAQSQHLVSAADVEQVTAGQSGLPRMDAVDIASYQGNLTVDDFKKMKDLGITGVIVKLTESTTYTNPFAATQVANARAAGMKVSAYHFSRYTNEDQARAEANYFADAAKNLGFASSDVLIDDLEASGTKVASVSSNARAFNNQLQSRGFTNPSLYTYVSYKNELNLDTSFVDNQHIWMAQYPFEPSADHIWNTEYGMWQWSSNVKIPGVSGTFDVSMDFTKLASAGSGTTVNQSAVATPTAATVDKKSGYLFDESSNGWRWFENGQLFTGFKWYADTFYWFENGVRSNNAWHEAWGNTYYTDADGRAVQGLQTIGDKRYYFGDDNSFTLRKNQTFTVNGQQYHSDANGVITNWSGYIYDGFSQNGGYRWYENGELYTGFRFYTGTYYWFIDGVRQNAGWRQAWGYTYYTDNDGRAVQGNQVIDGKVYNFGNDDTFYERPVQGYVWDGSAENGGYRWYENGQLFTGFRYYTGTYYWFIDGVRQNAGWREAWGYKYYTDNDGRAVQGHQTIDGQSYYFGNDGTYYLR
ncbi:Glucan-binding domain (YG repeat) [Fructobacillus fructosus]|uniref:GH25 family lysozyme n=1 Tax=Fructobacillus fructosus TaxID=1631 RepID=UPI002DB243B3|nr:Glucan-binding domain (YG repeat) [Fructobacillus fructosus]CAK1224195.1 Glucan-binding domain (YG repeat) [Fructobacillus fructosus]